MWWALWKSPTSAILPKPRAPITYSQPYSSQGCGPSIRARLVDCMLSRASVKGIARSQLCPPQISLLFFWSDKSRRHGWDESVLGHDAAYGRHQVLPPSTKWKWAQRIYKKHSHGKPYIGGKKKAPSGGGARL